MPEVSDFKKILIIGLGLIGGSIAKAVKKSKPECVIWAYDVEISAIEIAKKDGVVKGFCLIDEGISDFDLVIIATRIEEMRKILPQIASNINKKAVFIDIASVKNLDFLQKMPTNFVACHPIAGSEKTGYLNSSSDLFKNKKFLIADFKKNLSSDDSKIHERSVQKVTQFSALIGAQTQRIDAKFHDLIYALISHLPQFLSFCFLEFSPKSSFFNSIKSKNLDFLRSAFRLDNSDILLWDEIFKFNQKNIEFFYQKFYRNLEKMVLEIDSMNKIKIHNLLNNLNFGTLDNKQYLKNPSFNISNSEIESIKSLFPQLFFRILVVIAYLQIDEITEFTEFSGTGFSDFISILEIFSVNGNFLNEPNLDNLILANKGKIQEFFKKIS